MKKIVAVFFSFLFVVGCLAKNETFKGKEYQLQNAENKAEISLAFSAKENRFFGKAVNNYFGSYTLEGNNITFGPAGSTMMMGPRPLMDAESNYLKLLPKVKTVSLDGKKLVLKTDDGQELIFNEVGIVKE